MKRVFERYRVWVLCEDTRHYNFIRGFLSSCGVNDRKIRLCADLPEGKGSGEQFVRNHFAEAAGKYASCDENIFLVVAVDADANDVIAAENELNELLNSYSGKPEKLMMVIPKRNIETWFEWLSSEGNAHIDESEDYKQNHKHAKPKKIGEDFFRLYAKSLAADNSSKCERTIPSLENACGKFTRLFETLSKV
jgi:hypothetical protein